MQRLQQEKGMALLLVLGVIALLTSLLSEFAFSTLVDLRLTETFRDRTGAYYLARGGIEAGRIILQVDTNGYDHPDELWGQGVPNYPAGEGTVSIEIEDLSGRFNLNSVADNRGNPLPGYHRFVALCEEVLALSASEADSLAAALRDWKNADSQFVSTDESYYLQQQPPYSRKAGALDAVEELNLIKGFDAEMVEKLTPFVRVFGDNKLNINTASAELLFAWQSSAAAGNFQPILDRPDVDAIVEYRDQQPFESLDDLNQVNGWDSSWISAWQDATVKGTIYQIRGEGQVNLGIRVAEAIVLKTENRLLSLRVE
ncbi:MAG TPA: type II secretion system minor pseudopilin GspK [Geopsychrobacteraceae bacterium]|nr:type II secretion system minor pseudopilin GspK [Geopsychrobacteraceae bacterium]